MNKYRMFLIAALALSPAACKKKPAAPEPKPPVPVAAAEQVGVSSGSQLGAVLNAPGNYLRNTVGHVGEAKKAAALYNKTAQDSMNLDAAAGGGN
ncbi:MAG TPA: hypothetical protein PKI19_06910 [Elusimicrobiales bacterium]|nr:hypothetical protein [Elusimicrobiales bacterium]